MIRPGHSWGPLGYDGTGFVPSFWLSVVKGTRKDRGTHREFQRTDGDYLHEVGGEGIKEKLHRKWGIVGNFSQEKRET